MMKILVVDDSVVFRTQIANALKDIQGIEVVGSAPNGQIALQKLVQLSVDLVTLDLEMPEMDGMEVLRKIREMKIPCKVIVFSSQTTRGAEKALEALREGADDIVAKPNMSPSESRTPAEVIREALAPKVKQFIHQDILKDLKSVSIGPVVPAPTASGPVYKKIHDFKNLNAKAIVIASSTGGPNALEKFFSQVKKSSLPIVIAQHMPPIFTQIMAKRIQDICQIPCTEAKQGDVLEPNHIYIAPGDYHLEVRGTADRPQLHLHQAPHRNSVRPCADYLFESAAKVFGSHLIGVVLTGMGEDGMQGCRALKEMNAGVMIQNKESCVVFGMPGAVFQDGCFDAIGDLSQIALKLSTYLSIELSQERNVV